MDVPVPRAALRVGDPAAGAAFGAVQRWLRRAAGARWVEDALDEWQA